MENRRLHFLNNESSNEPKANQSGQAPANDLDLLDAYSKAVIGVVESVAPSVLSLSIRQPRGGSGSGFLVSADGHALTNSHVVAGSSSLIATTHEGDRMEADVLGDDPATDLALIKVRSSDLPIATLGISESLRVGQLVIALGSPFGLHSTVSTGVVSAIGRSMRGHGGRLIENVVQHSAPINPGNSGGPLVDSRGQVVGINTATVLQGEGLGFAVPANTAKWVAGEILDHGRVRRRQLGITARPIRLPKDLVLRLDLLAFQAVEVIDVEPRSAAASAGCQPGDIIVSLNDRIVSTIDELHKLLMQCPTGQSVELEVARNDRIVRLSV